MYPNAVSVFKGTPASGNSVKDQYDTSWYNKITGGDVEKSSAIAMANVDRDFQSSQALRSMEFTAKAI